MISGRGGGGGFSYRSAHERGADGSRGRGGKKKPFRQRRKKLSGGWELALEVPKCLVGKVIGRGGSQVRAIEDLSSTNVRIAKKSGKVRIIGPTALQIFHATALVMSSAGSDDNLRATVYPLGTIGRCSRVTRKHSVVLFEPADNSLWVTVTPLSGGTAWHNDAEQAQTVVSTAADNVIFAGSQRLADCKVAAISTPAEGEAEGLGVDWWLLMCGPTNADLEAIKNEVLRLWPVTAVLRFRDDPAYTIFFQMLRARVPRGAIENRMRAAGLEPSALDNPESVSTPCCEPRAQIILPVKLANPRSVLAVDVEAANSAAATEAGLSVDELRSQMEATSTALCESDLTQSNDFTKLKFEGRVLRSPFISHPRKKDRDAADQYYITDYCRCAIIDERCVLQCLEFAYPKIPSTILRNGEQDGLGALHLGGYTAAQNVEWLLANGVRRVVNAARGMELFPNFEAQRERCRSEGQIEFLDLGWDDSLSQTIRQEEIFEAITFIHEARACGDSVLIHCAAGRSRSAAVAAAYLVATTDELCTKSAIVAVQARRLIAKPNKHFVAQLVELEPSLQRLYSALRSSVGRD